MIFKHLAIVIGLEILLLCYTVTATPENDLKGKSVIDNSGELLDQLNVTELSEGFRNLSNALKGLRELILSTEISEDINVSDEDVFPVQTRPETVKTENIDDEPLDNGNVVNEEKSKELYEKAKVMLKSQLDTNKKAGYKLLLKASNDGCIDAKSDVAWEHLFGVNVKQNVTAALEMFKELVDSGHPGGHTGMAFLYALGVGVKRCDGKALLHFTLAALGGSDWARMALGYRYRYGISVRADCQKALEYYGQVADDVASHFKPHEGLKNNKISILDEEDKKNIEIASKVIDVTNFYEMMAEIGDIQAQFNLGKIFYHGTIGIERDVKKSLKYFKLAELNKNVEATAYIGKIYYEGSETTEIDMEEAFINFEKAAFYENPVGEAGLGLMYLEGKFVKQDTYKAFHYLSRSAHKGWVEGLIYLAKMHFDGIGIGRDYSLAKKYLLTASQAGHLLAYYYLGKMYENGLGSFRSCMTAVEFYKTVAEKGSWDNLFVNAYNKFRGREYNEAFMMFALLAEMGYAAGQMNSAMLLDDFSVQIPFVGEDEPQKLKNRKALQYWQRAARQGEPKALIRMGDHYYYGLGAEADPETAGAIYRYAANTYYMAEALYNLGYMHQHGVGLKKDPHLAKRYYEFSLANNEEGWVPVKLALLKLKVEQFLQFVLGLLINSNCTPVIKQFLNFAIRYWDIVAISVLSILCKRLAMHGFR